MPRENALFRNELICRSKILLRQVPSKNYKNLFILISKEYSAGEQDTKTAIDVAFIENLFWQVSNNDAKSYWDILPMNLKNLYVGFHGRSPL